MARSTSLSYTGTRQPGSVARNSKSNSCFEIITKTQAKQLVVCVENDGYAVSLEKRKIYVALRDTAARSTICCGLSMNPARTTSIRRHSSVRSRCRKLSKGLCSPRSRWQEPAQRVLFAFGGDELFAPTRW